MSHVQLVRLVEEKKWQEVREHLSHMHASDVAEFLIDHVGEAERAVIFRTLPRRLAAKVFAYFNPDEQQNFLESLTNQEVQGLLGDLRPDDRTALFEELPAKVARRLLAMLPAEHLGEARQLLGYPEQSIGRVMTPDYIAVKPDWTVERALEHIREYGRDTETIDILYVTGPGGKLEGYFKIKYLLLAKPGEKIADIPRDTAISLSASDDQERAVEIIKKYNLSALPVTDSEGAILGIVTIDDLIDIAEEEATEDFHKLAAIEVGERDISLTNIGEAGVGLLFRKRISWLVLLVGISIISAAIIANYQDLIAASVALVFFLPLLIGSSGNAGSQASTLMVRALGVGDVRLSDWGRLIVRESAVAALLGVTMALAVSFVGFFRAGVDIAAVVALSMVVVVIIGSLIGMSLPFILAKFRFDPATASAPLVTSIADICGVLIYFSIASWYLGF